MILRYSWSKRDLTLGIALCLALVSLAIVQYRLIGQVGEAERTRLDGAREAALQRLSGDFDGELDRLVQVLVGGGNAGDGNPDQRLPGDAPANDRELTLQAAAARLEYWKASSQHPQLVKQLFDASIGKQASLPPELSDLSKRIEQARDDIGRTGPGMALLVDTEVPALAMPMMRPNPGAPVDHWMIVELNLAYMNETWLPALVKRNFSSTDFEVMIVRGTDWDLDHQAVQLRNVIYPRKAMPAAGTVGANNPQAITHIPEEAQRANVFLLRLRGPGGRGRRGGFNGPPNGDGPPPERRGKDGKGGRDGRGGVKDKGKGFKGRGGPQDDGGRGAGFANGFDGFDGPGRELPESALPWHVLASYKSGLDSIVATFRRRNLAVSFGILMLTGLSVAMLMLSSRRASALAQQQMEFVAGVTHELRTPLAVISSASQNLADGITTSAEQTRRYGNVIHDQSKRLTDTVEQVLRFAGLSNDPGRARSPLSLQEVDTVALLEKSILECQTELDAAGMEVECDSPPDEAGNAVAVLGDPGALGHLLRNLLINAAKHGVHQSRGAQQWVRGNPRGDLRGDQGSAAPWGETTPLVQLSVRPAADSPLEWVEIQVTDNGPGIPSVDLPHIFEPFYRGRRATDDQIQGTGLGLSLAKKIVEAHSGSISVQSRQGEGTTFILRLPRGASRESIAG